MSIVNEKYSAARVNLLHQMLLNDYASGQPRDYEIKVDELRIIQRTNDPERFFLHEEFIQPDTRCLTISIYEGGSRKSTRYQLHFQEMPQQQQATLSGIEDLVKEKLEQHKQQLNKEQLEARCAGLEEQLSEAEKYHEVLERQIEELQRKKLNLRDHIGEIASQALEGLFIRNADKLRNVPVLGGLAGLIGATNIDANAAPETGMESASYASCTKADADDKTDNRLSAIEKVWMGNGEWLYKSFEKSAHDKIFNILKILSINPHVIDDTLGLLEDAASTCAAVEAVEESPGRGTPGLI
ncbi:MAG: hypothetical protein KGO82_05655 [Bacteroidota bacterium]|nr:hypothetical protein [Bacteroidota bacterium]